MSEPEQLLRVVGESVALLGPVIAVDASGRVVFATTDDRFEAPGATARASVLQRALQGTAVDEETATVRGPSGAARVVRACASPVRDGGGQVIGAWAVLFEETGRHLSLRQSERLAAIFQALPDLYFRVDSEGTYLEVIPGRDADLAAPVEQLLGRRARDVLPTDVATRLDAGLREALRTGSIQRVDYVLALPQGEQHFESRIVPASGGEAVIVVRNTTEQARNDAVLRFLVNSSVELGDIRHIDLALERVAQHAVPVLGDWCIVDLFEDGGEVRRIAVAHADPRLADLANEVRRLFTFDPRRGPFRKVLRTGRATRVPEVGPAFIDALARTPEERAVLDAVGVTAFMVAPLTIAGQVAGVIAVAATHGSRTYRPLELPLLETLARRASLALENARLTAVDQQARAEAEWRERQVLALVGAIREGVTLVDAHGNVVLRNARLREMLGLGEREVPAANRIRARRPSGEVVPFEQWPIPRLVRGESFEEEELVIERADGSLRRVIATGTIVRDERGELLGGIVVTRDVTELRRLEEQREDYVRAVSHDLRQPLAVVSNAAGLLLRKLQRTGLESESAHAERIARSVARMCGMLDELVDSAKLEAGHLELHRERVDVVGLVARARTAIASAEDQARIELVAPETVPEVEVDPPRFERVLVNLLTNAVKYSTPGTPILVRVETCESEVRISVEDQGVGIAPEELSRLFQRYFRSRTAGQREGVGLGLFIARLLVEAHGGRIWATSEANRGSTFSIALPLPERQRDAAGADSCVGAERIAEQP